MRRKELSLLHGTQKTTAEDGFAAGYCTAYAAMRMPQIFKSDNAFLGDAYNWDNRAKAAGWVVTTTPVAGSIAVYEPGQAGVSSLGHVAIVESVDPDNDLMTISDMNGPG